MQPFEFSEHGEVPCRVNPEAWFPARPNHLSDEEKIAFSICKSCMFREPCLEYALENAVEGTWGGTTDKDRALIRKRTGIKANPIAPRVFVPMQG